MKSTQGETGAESVREDEYVMHDQESRAPDCQPEKVTPKECSAVEINELLAHKGFEEVGSSP